MYEVDTLGNVYSGLPPYGGSGLKCAAGKYTFREIVSPSIRREWIEIPSLVMEKQVGQSPSIRREWIEIWESLTPFP